MAYSGMLEPMNSSIWGTGAMLKGSVSRSHMMEAVVH